MITSIRLIDVAMPRRAGARDLEARHKQSGLPLSWAAIVDDDLVRRLGLR